MRIVVLLLSLGLLASCGSDEDYARTASVEKEDESKIETDKDDNSSVSKGVAIVAGAFTVGIASMCALVYIKNKIKPKTCIRSMPNVFGIDSHSRHLRKLYKEGDLTKDQYKQLKKIRDRSNAFEQSPNSYEKAKLNEILEENRKK